MVEKRYLGDFSTIQYLEDSDLLNHLICPSLNDFDLIKRSPYRIIRGYPVFRFQKKPDGTKIVAEKKDYKIIDGKSVAYTRGEIKFDTDPNPISVHCNYQSENV